MNVSRLHVESASLPHVSLTRGGCARSVAGGFDAGGRAAGKLGGHTRLPPRLPPHSNYSAGPVSRARCAPARPPLLEHGGPQLPGSWGGGACNARCGSRRRAVGAAGVGARRRGACMNMTQEPLRLPHPLMRSSPSLCRHGTAPRVPEPVPASRASAHGPPAGADHRARARSPPGRPARTP